MSRAEEQALKAYPTHDGASEQWKKAHLSSLAEYIQGYEQAEKDLALTWEDIFLIDQIEGQVRTIKNRPEGEEYYKEVLRRFNEQREK